VPMRDGKETRYVPDTRWEGTRSKGHGRRRSWMSGNIWQK
jgi:hypothetical protein